VSLDQGSAIPLYQQVAADLRRRIVAGLLTVGARVPPHRELARHYDVSLMTINKALAGLVSEGVLHSRVGRGTFVAVRPAPAVPAVVPAVLPGAASSMPALSDGAEGRRGAPMLGFVLRDLSSPFFSLVAHSALQRADAAGYGLLFSSSLNRLDREEEQIRRFLDLGVQGLLIVSMSRTYRLSEPMQALHDAGIPYVMVSFIEGEDVPMVGVDFDDAGYLAGQHLVGVGRRRLGYLGDRFGSTMFELRSRGYRRAAHERGLGIDDRFVFEYPYEGEWNDYRSGFEVGVHIAALAEWPDAMYVHNDLGALGLLDGLLAHGVRVPEDIAVVGLDDIELAARAQVPLTTVRQPTERIGALAVDAVLAQLRGERAPTRQLLAPELIVRGSCGAPAATRTPDVRLQPAKRRPRSLAERRDHAVRDRAAALAAGARAP
jgi:DNA-binding LacI/PurR family transcriptional regulator